MPKHTILHISDLHLSPPEQNIGEGIHQEVLEDKTQSFKDNFKMSNQEGNFGDISSVIITGDLVNTGASDEFRAASNFLNWLSEELRINKRDIYVVPGNHDVCWEGQKSQYQRFENFILFSQPYSAPGFDENQRITPFCSELEKKIPHELMLFISPTFSGVDDPETESIYKEFEKLMKELSEEDREKVRKHLERGRKNADIAAFGNSQRSKIADRGNNVQGDPIRIAVFHHHLLPDPHIDIAPFDSIVDSGSVINLLINKKFDLVLTGHKHNRRLVQYSCEDQHIDVYSSPSLFKGRNSGFTIIDLNDSGNANYAELKYYDTDCRLGETHSLVRKGRVPKKIMQVCAGISSKDQTEKLIPLLEALQTTLSWRSNNGPQFEELFDLVWPGISNDFEHLENCRLVFKPPNIWNAWGMLIGMISNDKEIRLVSDNDLEFWENSENPGQLAYNYENPLREFLGKKTRIIVLSEEQLRRESTLMLASKIISRMNQNGFQVFVSLKDRIQDIPKENRPELDFGIVGDFAVSRFDIYATSGGSSFRSLQEDFSENAILGAERSWAALCSDAIKIWSTENRNDEGRSFYEWAKPHFL